MLEKDLVGFNILRELLCLLLPGRCPDQGNFLISPKYHNKVFPGILEIAL